MLFSSKASKLFSHPSKPISINHAKQKGYYLLQSKVIMNNSTYYIYPLIENAFYNLYSTILFPLKYRDFSIKIIFYYESMIFSYIIASFTFFCIHLLLFLLQIARKYIFHIATDIICEESRKDYN